MDKDTGIPQTPPQGQPSPAAADNPKNPFREDAPQVTPDPAEEAELEQQRKEALTERD